MIRKVPISSLILLAVLVSACDHMPTSPDSPVITPIPPTPTPPSPPPPPRYEPIPEGGLVKAAVAEDGTILSGMRAILLEEPRPVRGSTIILGPQDCSRSNSSCFSGKIGYQFDGVSHPAVWMRVEVFWSLDGKTPGEMIRGTSIEPGGSRNHEFGPWFFSIVPKYILVRLSHGAGDTAHPFPAEEGWVVFELDYNAK